MGALQGGVDRVAAVVGLYSPIEPRGSIAAAVTRLIDEPPLARRGRARRRPRPPRCRRLVHEADIVRTVVPDAGGTGAIASGGVIDGRQRLVIDLDQLGGIGRLVPGLGDDKGDVVADPADPLAQRRKWVANGRPSGGGGRRRPAGRPSRIAASPRRSAPITPGASLAGGVDRANPGMRMGRAQHVAEAWRGSAMSST